MSDADHKKDRSNAMEENAQKISDIGKTKVENE